MNRAERRRLLRRADGRTNLLVAGPKVEAKAKHHVADLYEPAAGVHMWVNVAMYRVANPNADRFDMDMENLINIEGPCCYICEQAWSPELAVRPCAGEPT